GYSQVDLAARVRVEKASLTPVLTSLERQGLIVRERGEEDQRRWYVWLTEEGQKLKKDLLPFAPYIDGIATEGLSQREVKELKRLLSHVLTNLQSALPD